MNVQTETRQQTEQRPQTNNVPALAPSRLPISPAIAKEFELQPTEWRVLVEQIFPAAKTVEAVMMALAYCRKRNLDIFKKPVHIVPMWSSAKRQMVETVWPGIAEIRTTAARTGQYAGIDAVEFGPMVERTFSGQTGGNNTETVTKKVSYPEWASVVVYRITAGAKCAYHAKVYWEETYATMGKSDVPNEMWGKRPRGQLDKCVEAAALRKAFPEELGNTYAAEEMEGREIDGGAVIAAEPQKPPAPPRPPETAREPVKIIEHDEPTVEEMAAANDEIVSDGDFFQQLEDALATATDEATAEEIWDSFDPMARFDGKPHGEVNQGISQAIKRRALKRIGGA